MPWPRSSPRVSCSAAEPASLVRRSRGGHISAMQSTPPAPAAPPPPPPPETVKPAAAPAPPAQGWRYAAREFVIIVAGVLAALAAQAMWQGYENRQREAQYVQQLLEDTRENERRIGEAIAIDSTAASDMGVLANALYSSAPLPPDDSLHALFGSRAFRGSDLQPLSGTYNAVINAGDLRLIRTDSLRAMIVAYSAMLAHEQSMLRFFLEQSAGRPDLLSQPMPFLRRMVFGDRGDSLHIDFAALRQNTAAESVFFAMQIANMNRVNHLRRLREETLRLRRALEAE
jgi:hypothetical protein